MNTNTHPNPNLLITPARGNKKLCLILLSLSLFTITVDMTILNVALPHITEDLHATSTQQLWIVDAYSLVMAGSLISASALGDRYGRRLLLILGAALAALASAGVLAATTPHAVIALRVLLGLGSACMMPSTLSLIRVVFPDPRQRATALGIWAAIASVGAAIGPLIGGLLLEVFTWHSAFLVAIPPMLATCIGGYLFLPEARLQQPPTWDWLSAALSMAGMATLLWAIKHAGEELTLTSPTVWLPAAAGLATLTAFIRRCRRVDNPLLKVGMFRYPIFTAGVGSAVVANFALAGALLLSTQWLQLVEGLSPLWAGVMTLPMAAVSVAGSLVVSTVAARVGLRWAAAGSLGLIAAGLVGVGAHGVAAAQALSPVGVAAWLVLVGAGIGGLALASSMIMGGVPAAAAGSAAAMEDTAYEFGSVVGVTVLGSLASVVFRARLDVAGVDTIAGAFVATGGRGQVWEVARGAFTSAFGWTCLVGGVVVVVAAVVLGRLVPVGARVDDLHN